jgi:hypothetical protein
MQEGEHDSASQVSNWTFEEVELLRRMEREGTLDGGYGGYVVDEVVTHLKDHMADVISGNPF